jgi:hypothetical protein
MSANDSEWIKILVSAVVGMFTGLAADPIRSLIQNRIETRKLKNAVMWDIANLSTSAMRVHNEELNVNTFWLGIELPSFDYYWDKNRELFYANSKLILLRVQCQLILRLRDLMKMRQVNPDEAMKKFWETLKDIKHSDEMSWFERRRLARSVRTKPEGSVAIGEAVGPIADSDPD